MPTLNGEVSIGYAVNNISSGVKVTPNAISPIMKCDEPKKTKKVQINCTVGLNMVTALKALCIDEAIADPGVYVYGKVSADYLEKRRGYENLKPCVDLKGYVPLVDIRLMNSDEPVLKKC